MRCGDVMSFYERITRAPVIVASASVAVLAQPSRSSADGHFGQCWMIGFRT